MSGQEAYFASRAMQAIEVLAFQPSTATELAAALRVHPRTARRLMNRMADDGWVIREEGNRPAYTPTLRIIALAGQLTYRFPLVRHALVVANDLHARTSEPVHLAIPSYRWTLRLIRATDRPDDVQAVRDLAPAHATAAGKLLLAHREPWRDAILATPLEAMTSRTLTDPGELRSDLDRTRMRGYAIEDDEFRAGLRALAAPVTSAEGDVVAALALSTRRDRTALLAHQEAVTAAAADLSSQLA